MPLAGIPQWAGNNFIAISATTGGTSETDRSYINGNTFGNIFAESTASHQITGGPTSAGPVTVIVNGVCYTIPYNVGTTYPPHVQYALGNASLAGWVAT